MPADNPGDLALASMAYDPATSELVLFGGYNEGSAAGFSPATWTWDGTNWTEAATTGPPARVYAAMAYDPDTTQMFVFGGESGDTDGSILGDTWAVEADLALTDVPSDITTNATSAQGALVDYTPPEATDGDDSSAPTPTCSEPSGSVFPIGTTTVTCSVSDADDWNGPVTASFAVTVQGASSELSQLDTVCVGSLTKASSGKSLCGEVTAAGSDLAAGDVTDTCGALASFVGMLDGKSAKNVFPDDVAVLLADTQNIQTVLSC